MGNPEFHLRTQSSFVVLEIRGELDIYGIRALEAALRAALEQATTAIVLDLSGLSYADSSTIGALAMFRKNLEGSKIDFAIVTQPHSSLRKILELSGMTARFSLFPTLAEALGKK